MIRSAQCAPNALRECDCAHRMTGKLGSWNTPK
jgi:hypothetical protein